MLFLFRKLTLAYVAIVVAGLVYFFVSAGQAQLMFWMISLLWIVLCTMMGQTLAQRKLSKINRLRMNCQLSEYLARYEKIIKDNPKANFLNRNARQMVQLNLILGYLNIGDDAKAERLLFEDAGYIPQETKPKTLTYRLLYYIYLITYQIEHHEFEQAEQSLEVFRELAQQVPTRKPYEDALRTHHSLQIRLALEQGDLSEAETYYTRLAEAKKPTQMSAVTTRLCLAKVFWWKQDGENLEEMVRFVEQNAGQTCYAQQARELLETKPDHEPNLLTPADIEAAEKAELAAQLMTEEDPPLLDPDEMEQAETDGEQCAAEAEQESAVMQAAVIEAQDEESEDSEEPSEETEIETEASAVQEQAEAEDDEKVTQL